MPSPFSLHVAVDLMVKVANAQQRLRSALAQAEEEQQLEEVGGSDAESEN